MGKIVGKSTKYVFYIHTNIVTKKWGKNGRNGFLRKHEYSEQKRCETKVGKKYEKPFFIFTRIS